MKLTMETRRSIGSFEVLFNAVYLPFTLFVAITLLVTMESESRASMFGLMALILVLGDSFHLVPRILMRLRGRSTSLDRALGFGKMITSISMTIFYLLLYRVWESVSSTNDGVWFTLLLLAGIRAFLCLMPMNRWADPKAPIGWAIARNIPFVAIGAIICALFTPLIGSDSGLHFISIAVAGSFLCYAPVVLFSRRFPPVGILMIPKTLCYVWIILMGFSM